MRKFLLLLFLASTTSLLGQYSLIYDNGSAVESVQTRTMKPQNNDKLKKENVGKDFSSLVFAKALEVEIDCDKDGTWESIPNNKLIWRLKIQSNQASSINLSFAKYIMPKNGYMIIFSADREHMAGPFTDFDNRTDGQLWSPIIKSDEIIIQVVIPAQSIKEFDLAIDKVNHGFKGGLEKSFSQSCHLDVLCGTSDGFEEVENYRDAIRSVGVYSIEGTRLCTGALINNTKDNCIPYFLTANHCGVRENNTSTIVVHWKFENQTCRQPNSNESGGIGNGRLDISNNGVKILATYPSSDMQLLELDKEVPVEAEPYYAGWNISTQPPSSAVCIHHPNADEKRISFENNPVTPYTDDDQFWYVGDWEIGSTESGSSGAPLFNSDQEIIGQVFGGEASCGNGLWDIFGRIDRSWAGDGTEKGALKTWLDPDNSGVTRYSGRNCSALLNVNEPVISICNNTSTEYSVILSANEGFSSPAQLSFESPNDGIGVTFENNVISSSDPVIANIIIDDEVPSGSYDLKIIGNENATQAISFVTLQISKVIPQEVMSTSPTKEGTVGTQILFEWIDDYDSYDIEISSTSNFNNVTASANDIEENSFNVTTLSEETEYFWRVRGINACGIGEWSTFTFETGKIECITYTSQDLPKDIDDGDANIVESIITVLENRTITDVNIISLEGRHSWVGDLQFRLISPSGTEITLVDQECDRARNFHLGFDDSADTGVVCPISDSSNYQPNFPLSSFNNELSAGDWTLRILDLEDFDGGSFDKWEIEICTNTSKNTVSTDDQIADVIKTYPNPIGNILFVEQQQNIKYPNYAIYNAVGAQMLSDNLGSSIDVSNLPNGLYFLQIREASKVLGFKKIIISK